MPYDCGVAVVAHPEDHSRAMDIHGAYLPESERHGARDPMDLVPEMSRRARAFPIWATLRAYGREPVSSRSSQRPDANCLSSAWMTTARLSSDPAGR